MIGLIGSGKMEMEGDLKINEGKRIQRSDGDELIAQNLTQEFQGKC
jgi:hypothetical protein